MAGKASAPPKTRSEIYLRALLGTGFEPLMGHLPPKNPSLLQFDTRYIAK